MKVEEAEENARWMVVASLMPESAVFEVILSYSLGLSDQAELNGIALSDALKRTFRAPECGFWALVAGLERGGFMPSDLAAKLSAELGWEPAPFCEQLRARAEKVREGFLGAL